MKQENLIKLIAYTDVILNNLEQLTNKCIEYQISHYNLEEGFYYIQQFKNNLENEKYRLEIPPNV